MDVGSSNEVGLALAGETLYSVCARQAFWSRLSSRSASFALLGHGRGAAMHEVPVGLERLELCFGPDALGIDLHALRTRTVLGAVLPFVSPARGAQLLAAVRSAQVGRCPRVLLGMNRNEEYLGLVLRRCPDCAALDRAEFGFTYWHAPHQFAGVWVCPWHLRPLQWLPAQSRRHPTWLVAERSGAEFNEVPVDAGLLELLIRVAFAVVWTATHRSLSHTVLSIMVRSLLREAGLTRRELFTDAADDVRIHAVVAEPLYRAGIAHFMRFDTSEWVPQTLGQPEYARPLRWALLLASALPSDWNPPAPGATSNSLTSDHVDLGIPVPKLLEYQFGVARLRTPQMALFGADYQPKRQTAPESLYDALQGGQCLSTAARAAGMDLAEAQRWIRKDRHLHDHWREAIAADRIREATKAIGAVVAAHPNASRSQVIKAAIPAVRSLERYAPQLVGSLLPPVHRKFSRQGRLTLD